MKAQVVLVEEDQCNLQIVSEPTGLHEVPPLKTIAYVLARLFVKSFLRTELISAHVISHPLIQDSTAKRPVPVSPPDRHPSLILCRIQVQESRT